MLSERLESLRLRVGRACEISNRNPAGVTLIAVTKTVPVDQIQAAYDLGVRHFGESKLQEAIPKIEALPSDVAWHFIGQLQSNKAKKVAELFTVIHALDSENQLREIEKGRQNVEGLIEVNIADEPQKSGISTETLDEYVKAVLQCHHVRFRGLMTIGPNLHDPEQMRPFFGRLRKLGEQVGAEWLSMGMSADFDVAIQEGATHIRVGSALFGERR